MPAASSATVETSLRSSRNRWDGPWGHFSRDHLDRLLAAATGESPVQLRRRLLLERAAWQLRTGAASASAAAVAAGYGSGAAFSRAFARAHGIPPRAFAASGRAVQLDAPNGIHLDPPAGLLLPGGCAPVRRRNLVDRLVAHHLEHSAGHRKSFSYGGVVAHVLTYGAIRREALASVLAELGAPPRCSADPLEREERLAQDLR